MLQNESYKDENIVKNYNFILMCFEFLMSSPETGHKSIEI